MARFISIRQAAQIQDFPLSYHLLRKGIQQGRFPYITIGRRYLIDLEQIHATLAAEARENQRRRQAARGEV